MTLRTENLVIERRGRRLLDRISLDLVPGQVLGIIGPNGAGKTTLVSALAGDLRPAGGSVTLDGLPLADWSPLALAQRRAVMPQANRLGFSLPVQDVVALGRAAYHGRHSRHADAAAIDWAIRAADVAHLAQRSYATLSGGEQQRVQLARAIAQLDLAPGHLQSAAGPVLLLDEPTASLDLAHAHGVLRLARDLACRGVAVAAVLHDLSLAHRYADRLLVLRSGRAVAIDAPQQALAPELIRNVFAVEAVFLEGNLVVRGPALYPAA
ncbi:MAG: heme ABC transporter ATP-binding protein [Ferrovibrio sp.]|jgi:iron complex transport system ATP-binding protein|uniref:heme ABC transporter ATP-binding protein n=1 Tax=Ferrovibrio sp. TaxID=1917215 RepID=UPI00391CCC7D